MDLDNKDRLAEIAKTVKTKKILVLDEHARKTAHKELNEIRLHLEKEFSKGPSEINSANEQESRHFEKLSLERQQLLEKFEKRNNEIASLALAMEVIQENQETINTSLIPQLEEVEKGLEQIEQNLENAAVKIKTAWEKYINKTTKTTLLSVSFLSGIFICYKTGLLTKGLTYVKPLLELLSSFWKTQTTTVAKI